MIANDRMTPLFEACAEATEEAILNALCMATTTVGINDFTMHALPLHRVREICAT
jgi:D-aminopeptidase